MPVAVLYVPAIGLPSLSYVFPCRRQPKTKTNRLHWRERKVAFGFQLFSACLSLTVGVLWLVLKSCGLLERVFG